MSPPAPQIQPNRNISESVSTTTRVEPEAEFPFDTPERSKLFGDLIRGLCDALMSGSSYDDSDSGWQQSQADGNGGGASVLKGQNEPVLGLKRVVTLKEEEEEPVVKLEDRMRKLQTK